MRVALVVSVVSVVAASCACDGANVDAADAGVVVDAGVVDDDDDVIVEGACVIDVDAAPDGVDSVACRADFDALASTPLDATLPGARSVKVGFDRQDPSAAPLWFQHSTRFPIHYEYASAHRSGGDLPLIGDLGTFNTTEYFSPERRFLLGAVTHYEGPDVWALEISPYDTASPEMITTLFTAVKARGFFGPALRFHPTSEAVAATVAALPLPLVTTDELYAGIDVQPLSVGTAIGRLRFESAANLETVYLSPEEIVVLDQAPNDISTVQGLITEEFQTPLSHVNILAQNRGSPNMGLRGAMTNPELRALEGQYVAFTVTTDGYTVVASTAEEAAAFFEASRGEPVVLPPLDLTKDEIVAIADVTATEGAGGGLRAALVEATRAYGGKAAQYAVLARTEGLPVRPAFAVPVFFYDQFMRENGFVDRVAALLVDDAFNTDAAVRDAALAALRDDMLTAPVNVDFQDALMRTIVDGGFGIRSLRYRTSTNSEDLDGFPCAGCYESHTGDPKDWDDTLDAIRETWSTVWLFRTFEERRYYGVDHLSVGMALLVHENFPDEEANGVAVTNNPFDPSGLSPAFYVNVQTGGVAEVVHPPSGVTSDQFLSYFSLPNQPTAFLSHSNLVDDGATVLTARQVHDLGVALNAIHNAFSDAYGPGAGNSGWYGMDVEFKFDQPSDDDGSGAPQLFIKQARPFPQVE
jgi:hypothetical protein